MLSNYNPTDQKVPSATHKVMAAPRSWAASLRPRWNSSLPGARLPGARLPGARQTSTTLWEIMILYLLVIALFSRRKKNYWWMWNLAWTESLGKSRPSPWENPASPRRKLGPQDLCLCPWTQGSTGPEKPFIELVLRCQARLQGNDRWSQCPHTFCGCRNPAKWFLASKLV